MFPCSTIILLTVILKAKAEWELSVCVGDRVEWLDSGGESLGSRSLGLSGGGPDVLALDSLAGQLFLADSRRPDPTIFGLKLGPSAAPHPLRSLVPKASGCVAGVAYDAVERAVYWTTGRQGSIQRSLVSERDEASTTQLVHSLPAQVPHGIAVDSCRRKLYWSNCNMTGPSIETSGLDGTERTLLVEKDLFQPLALTLSQGDGWLYWVDERAGYSFTVERIRLDATERQTLVRSSHQQPIALAVVPGERVYWTDQLRQAVWRLDLPGSPDQAASRPALVKEYRSSVPSGLVALRQDTGLDPVACSNLIRLRNQSQALRWSGRESCPPDYCLHGGACSTDESNLPGCRCTLGYLGDRCQYESRLCSTYCLDPASVTDSVLFKSCMCLSDAHGYWRQGSAEPLPDRASTWRLAALCLCGLCLLFVVSTVALAVRNRTLSKRPKLRRRYTVNKSTGSFKRSDGGGAAGMDPSQCDIGDIENCCNMNICETPCYEPEFRTPTANKTTSRSIEHRSLISDMEVPEPSRPPLF